MRARGKNVRRRPVPGGRAGSRGVKRRAVRTEEDRDLVSRGAEQETKDEQEDLRIYESEVAVLLHGASFGRRDRRNRRIRPL